MRRPMTAVWMASSTSWARVTMEARASMSPAATRRLYAPTMRRVKAAYSSFSTTSRRRLRDKARLSVFLPVERRPAVRVSGCHGVLLGAGAAGIPRPLGGAAALAAALSGAGPVRGGSRSREGRPGNLGRAPSCTDLAVSRSLRWAAKIGGPPLTGSAGGVSQGAG